MIDLKKTKKSLRPKIKVLGIGKYGKIAAFQLGQNNAQEITYKTIEKIEFQEETKTNMGSSKTSIILSTEFVEIKKWLSDADLYFILGDCEKFSHIKPESNYNTLDIRVEVDEENHLGSDRYYFKPSGDIGFLIPKIHEEIDQIFCHIVMKISEIITYHWGQEKVELYSSIKKNLSDDMLKYIPVQPKMLINAEDEKIFNKITEIVSQQHLYQESLSVVQTKGRLERGENVDSSEDIVGDLNSSRFADNSLLTGITRIIWSLHSDKCKHGIGIDNLDIKAVFSSGPKIEYANFKAYAAEELKVALCEFLKNIKLNKISGAFLSIETDFGGSLFEIFEVKQVLDESIIKKYGDDPSRFDCQSWYINSLETKTDGVFLMIDLFVFGE